MDSAHPQQVVEKHSKKRATNTKKKTYQKHPVCTQLLLFLCAIILSRYVRLFRQTLRQPRMLTDPSPASPTWRPVFCCCPPPFLPPPPPSHPLSLHPLTLFVPGTPQIRTPPTHTQPATQHKAPAPSRGRTPLQGPPSRSSLPSLCFSLCRSLPRRHESADRG